MVKQNDDWQWMAKTGKGELTIKSQSTAEVRQEADALLAAVAGQLNQIDVYPVTVGDVLQALTAALGERLGQQGSGVVIIWYEAGEVQINVVGTR